MYRPRRIGFRITDRDDDTTRPGVKITVDRAWQSMLLFCVLLLYIIILCTIYVCNTSVMYNIIVVTRVLHNIIPIISL